MPHVYKWIERREEEKRQQAVGRHQGHAETEKGKKAAWLFYIYIYSLGSNPQILAIYKI